MKRVKRVLALLAAFALVLAMAVPAWADGATCSITAPNNGHTYEVYQIFTGTLSEEVLSDIKWGQNGTNGGTPVTVGGSVPETVLKEITGVAEKSDSEKLKVIEKYVDLTADKKFITVNSGATQNVPAGYYLIKDADNSYNDKHDAYTQFIVEVAGNVNFKPKTDYPTVEKKVKENSKETGTTGDYGEKYNDVADYSIGDAVPFKLIGSVPDMSQYSTYKYTFHDTLANSLKAPDKADVKVYMSSNKAGSGKQDITSNFTVTVSGQEITVHTEDLKAIDGISAGKYILVEYSAVLNSNAAINNDNVADTDKGNINKVYLTYSNNPRNESEAGKTPEDTVIVFTYKIEATKVDGETSKELQGVTFRIYKMSGDDKLYAQVAEGKLKDWITTADDNCVLTSGKDGKFSLAGLDDGTYFIEEINPLPGYNSIDPVEIQVNGKTNNGQDGNGATSELTSVTFTVGGKTENAITIVNNAGTTLPSTGGMGTTVFYVVGGGLMAVAVVLLVTKKRMENKR